MSAHAKREPSGPQMRRRVPIDGEARRRLCALIVERGVTNAALSLGSSANSVEDAMTRGVMPATLARIVEAVMRLPVAS